jgi:hypothetical protein
MSDNYNIIAEGINVGGDDGIKPNLSKFCDDSKSEDEKVEIIANIAKSIWKKIIEYNLKNKITADTELILLQELRIEYNDFFLSFPLILRWMVQIRQFKINIFKSYVRKFINTEMRSKIDFLKLQGEYVVMLFKALNPNCSANDLKSYEDNIMQLLIKEDETFKKIEEEAKEELKKEDDRISKERREHIYNMILKKKSENA